MCGIEGLMKVQYRVFRIRYASVDQQRQAPAIPRISASTFCPSTS